jgi:ABC-type phosphate/phosphonate transport system ATPase subunit
VIVPIVGRSGIGKSHVIRWLDAQLRRRPGHERRVIIRIPKGMSLKGCSRPPAKGSV